MARPDWDAVDNFIGDRLIGENAALEAALAANSEAGLPAIDVSPAQGKLLHLLVRMTGARRVLEIGTLGGYSTIWMARALPEDGRIVTLEIDPDHARVAQANLARARLSDRVEIRVGVALETLSELTVDEPVDFTFIDADKQNNAAYLREAMRLSRPGAVIVCDNVVREGRVTDADSGDPAIEGTRALLDALAQDAALDATAIQTVGLKGWDGFAIAIVGDQ